MKHEIVLGKKKIFFDTPTNFNITNVISAKQSHISDIESATKKSLSLPINSKLLSELAKGKSDVCIVVTDITRSCPDNKLLPPIIEELEKEIDRNSITILIASGMHRTMSHQEKILKYGEKIVDTYKIIDHDSKDEKNLVDLGITKNGTPIKMSKIAIDSSLLISTGVVSPHQYAGYSGGYKTVSIGVASDETISYTHSHVMIKNPKTVIGNVIDNPFYEDIIEIGKKSGLDFIVNVILGKNNDIFEIKSGNPFDVHNALIKSAKMIYEFPVEKQFDVVICGIGFPKDANLYQTTTFASYISFVPKPIVKKGGYIVLPSECPEGAGKGVGEQRFFSLLKNKTIDEILGIKEFRAGEQRAFVMANVLKNFKIILVGAKNPEIIEDAKMIAANNMNEAFDIIKKDLGENLDVLINSDSLTALPIIY